MPAARVIAIDTDPVLLALGRTAYGDRDGLRFADVDLRSDGWTGALGLDRPADAAVSTTALHWLRPEALHVMYARLATVLRPGGLLLDGDDFKDDAAAVPTLARLGQALIEREEQRRFPDGLPESWSGWWDGIKEDPALAAPVAEREQRQLSEDHHGSESVQLATHVDGLRAAGFAEIGTLWQRGENRILAGVARPDGPGGSRTGRPGGTRPRGNCDLPLGSC